MQEAGENGIVVVVTTPVFSIGARCSQDNVIGLSFLPVSPVSASLTGLYLELRGQLLAYFDNPAFRFDLPLLVSGTPFQRAVWQEISRLEAGTTSSYGEIAIRLNSAPRAVGQACGANRLPVVIPCHRVIAAKGRMGGFAHQRSGFLMDVKRWLLVHEQG